MRSVVAVSDGELLVSGLQLRGGRVGSGLEGEDRILKVAQPLEGMLLFPLRLPGIRGLAQSRPDAVLQPLAGLAVPPECRVRDDARLVQLTSEGL